MVSKDFFPRQRGPNDTGGDSFGLLSGGGLLDACQGTIKAKGPRGFEGAPFALGFREPVGFFPFKGREGEKKSDGFFVGDCGVVGILDINGKV